MWKLSGQMPPRKGWLSYFSNEGNGRGAGHVKVSGTLCQTEGKACAKVLRQEWFGCVLGKEIRSL